jgi:hypothetical protein
LRVNKSNLAMSKERRLTGKPPGIPFLRRENEDNTVSQSRSTTRSYQSTSGGSTRGLLNVKGSSASGTL